MVSEKKDETATKPTEEKVDEKSTKDNEKKDKNDKKEQEEELVNRHVVDVEVEELEWLTSIFAP